MTSRHINSLVVFAAWVTGGMTVAMLIFLGGHFFVGWFTQGELQFVARIWSSVCLGYLMIQCLPLVGALTADEREFKVDKITSGALIASAIIWTIIYVSKGFEIPGIPKMLFETFLTGILEVLIVVFAAHVRRQYRSGVPARVAALEADRDWLDARVRQLEGAYPGGAAAIPAAPNPRP